MSHVQNAQMLAQTQRLTANLQRAMVNRSVIDQAIGFIISRTGITPEEAFHRIRTRSQKEHVKVSVARSIVDSAGRRARGLLARGRPTSPEENPPDHEHRSVLSESSQLRSGELTPLRSGRRRPLRRGSPSPGTPPTCPWSMCE
jgi:hypothetical protein